MTCGYGSQPRGSQKHYVEPKGHEGVHVRVVLLNVFAFLLIFVTLKSPPPDESHYCLQHRLIGNFHEGNSSVNMYLNKCSQRLLIVLIISLQGQTHQRLPNGLYEFPLLFKIIYHINYGVRQGFPALRKAVITDVKKYDVFSRVFDIADQLLTRHSPFGPLGQVDPLSIQGRFYFRLWLLKE